MCVWPAVVCSAGYKLWGGGVRGDCPTEYSASLEAAEVRKGNVSVSTHLQVLPTASLHSLQSCLFELIVRQKKSVISCPALPEIKYFSKTMSKRTI